jgi:hypothetical protein
MWPFKKRLELPGIEWGADGQITWTLTDEEEVEIRELFAMLVESEGEGCYIGVDTHKAMTAWGLLSYAQHQVMRADRADSGTVERNICFRKALAAATKAYSSHPLPIYMFDIGCILEMLGDEASARDAFRSFLESYQNFEPADVDEIAMRHRDIGVAVKEARQRMGT